jgi:O-antigen ligase
VAQTVVATAPGVSLARSSALPLAVSASVVAVAAVSPFERALPGTLFGFTLTTVEVALLIALGCGAVAWMRRPSMFDWRTPITRPLVLFLICAVFASLAAPELSGNALRVTARLAAATLLFLLVANVAALPSTARQIVAALLAAGSIVGSVAVLELAQVPWVLDALKAFRPGFHVVGGQLRATSTMFYPTITSMFLEVVFALGLLWLPRSRVAWTALVITGGGVIATFTRAGLITMALSMAIYGGVTWMRTRQWSLEHTRLVALAVALVVLVVMSRSPQMLVARMTSEGSQEWYGASYRVPQQLTLRPDSFNDIPVTLKNEGRLTWQSSAAPPFALSYHWLTSRSEEVVIFDGLRTPFAQPVEPGDEVRMTARVRAPGYPGDYVLIWDVVQEHRTWLSLEGVYPGRSLASVEGAAVGAPLPTRGRMPSGVMRMPRSVLWQTAFAMWRERPLLGIGPDNFRHTYGRYLGLAAWDARVHSNNSYVEVLVSMGVAGAIAVGWLMTRAAASARAIVASADAAALPVAAAALAACMAIAVHALVDSFLTFTPTYVVFAIAAGLLFRRSTPSAQPC